MKASRRPQFWFGLVMWLLSFVITGLLIQLGSLIMSDLPTAKSLVKHSDFVNQVQLEQIQQKIETQEERVSELELQIENALLISQSRSADYKNARENFQNWVKTREATQSVQYNDQLVERTKEIENLKAQERMAQKRVEQLSRDRAEVLRELSASHGEIRQVQNAADEPYEKARKWEVLKVFLMRLLITLPLLLISTWFVAKKRKSKYWPLYRGFLMFSLFAFFVELVPYLPSYGGYIRLIVGIVMALGFAHFAIKAMTRYLERKQDEESRPEEEKRQVIVYETAIKKITDGVCPSCDRQFHADLSKNADKENQPNIDFCVHCGFCLFDTCSNCETRANSFYKFCASCGVKSNQDETLS